MAEIKRYVYIEMTDKQYQAQSSAILSLEKIGQRICNADIEQAYKDKISSLITTIESQKEKLTKYSNLFLSLEASFLKFLSLTNIKIDTHPSVELQAEAVNQLLESQKEEIEKWNSLRPEVQWFAERMEATLKRHDNKGGWGEDKCSMNYLLESLEDKVTQLSVSTGYMGDNVQEIIIRNCTHVANFALMIADRMAQLTEDDLKITVEVINPSHIQEGEK